MISTLPGDFQKVRDRLLNFDTEVPDVLFNEEIESNPQPDNSYTTSLAESTFAMRPNSHPRSSSCLPPVVSTMQGFGGSAHVLGIPSDEQHNLHQGKTPSTPANQTADRAVLEDKTRSVDIETLGCQSRQLADPPLDIRPRICMESIQSSDFPPNCSAGSWTSGLDIGNAYRSSLNEEPLAGAFNIEGKDIRGIDDFFDFESWF